MKNCNFKPLFYLSNELISLFEVKKTDFDENTSKERTHYWLTIDNKSKQVSRLVFQASKSEIVKENKIEIRIFKNAELRLHGEFAKFTLDEKAHLLMLNDSNSIPLSFNNEIENYFKKCS